jgi:hypothetical protein
MAARTEANRKFLRIIVIFDIANSFIRAPA